MLVQGIVQTGALVTEADNVAKEEKMDRADWQRLRDTSEMARRMRDEAVGE